MSLDPNDPTYEPTAHAEGRCACHPDIRRLYSHISEVCLDWFPWGKHHIRYHGLGAFIPCPKGEACPGEGCDSVVKVLESEYYS